MISEKFDFLTAPRFWSSVVTSIGIILVDPNFPTQQWYVSLGKFLGLLGGIFTAVGTIDNYSKKQVDIARINADVSVAQTDKSETK